MAELHYEPRVAARPVVVEEDDGVTRIIVPMQGFYLPPWLSGLDELAVVVVPLWLIWVALAHLCHLPRPNPPRALFEVSREQFRMTLRDDTGETISEFPRTAVVEVRANRYDPGLWLNVTGHVKETYLADLPRDTIERLEAALRDALAATEETGCRSGDTPYGTAATGDGR